MFSYTNASDYLASVANYDLAARSAGAAAEAAREAAERAAREAEDKAAAKRRAAAKRALKSAPAVALRSALAEANFRTTGKPSEMERRGRAILAAVEAGESVPSDVAAVTSAVDALYR